MSENFASQGVPASIDHEILYLVYKYLSNRSGFSDTNEALKRELDASSLLGSTYSWDGRKYHNTTDRMDKLFGSIGGSHLQQVLSSLLESNDSSVSLLAPLNRIFHRDEQSNNDNTTRKSLLRDLKECYSNIADINNKMKHVISKRKILNSKLSNRQNCYFEDVDLLDVAFEISVSGQMHELASCESLLTVLKSDQESERKEIESILKKLGSSGGLMTGSWTGEVRNIDTWLFNRSLGLNGHSRCVGSGLSRIMSSSAGSSIDRFSCNYKILWTISGHMFNPAYCCVFDKTGEYIITGADDFLVKVWNVKKNLLVHTLKGHQGYIALIEVSPDNSIVASACTLGTIRLWNLKDGRCLMVLNHGGSINWIKFDETSFALASAGDDGNCVVWDLAKILKQKLDDISYDDKYFSMINLLSSSRLSLHDKSSYVSPDMTVSVTDAASSSSTDARLVTNNGSYRNGLFKWSDETKGGDLKGRLVLTHMQESFQLIGIAEAIKINCLDISPFGEVLITGCEDGIARVWKFGEMYDEEHATRATRSETMLSSYRGIVSSQDYRKLEITEFHLMQNLKGHVSAITDIKFSSMGDRLVTGSLNDGTVRIWAFNRSYTKNEHIVLILKDDDNTEVQDSYESSAPSNRRTSRKPMKTEVFNVAWTCDDVKVITLQSVVTSASMLLSAGSNKETLQPTRLKVWDSYTGDLLRTISYVGQVACKLLSPHPLLPHITVTCGMDGLVNIWNIEYETIVASHKICDLDGVTPSHLVDTSFSPDGQYLAVTDIIGRLTLLGLDKHCDRKNIYFDQYFSADYSDIIVDAEGNAFDAGTQLPMHLAPRGLLCRIDGYAYDNQPPSLLGPSSLTEDEVIAINRDKRKKLDSVKRMMDRNYVMYQRIRVRGRQPRTLSWSSVVSSTLIAAESKTQKSFTMNSRRSSSGQRSNIVTIGDYDQRMADRVAQYISDSDSSAGECLSRRNRSLQGSRRSQRLVRLADGESILNPEQQRIDRQRRAARRAASREGNTVYIDDEDESDNDELFENLSSTDSEDHLSSDQSNQGIGSRLRTRKAKRSRYRRRNRIRIVDDDHDNDNENENEDNQQPSTSGRKFNRRNQQNLLTTKSSRRSARSEFGWGVLNAGKKTIAMDAQVDRLWLQDDRTYDSQYVPQIGDQVIYFPQGHIEVLHQFAEGTSPPWHAFPQRWPLVECIVKNVSYEFPSRPEHRRCQSVLATLTLVVTSIPFKRQLTATSEYHVEFVPPMRQTRHNTHAEAITFKVTLRNCNLPDYIVPSYIFNRCLRTPWHEGIKICVSYTESTVSNSNSPSISAETEGINIREEKKYTARVVGLANASDDWPNSPWEALRIQFESDSNEHDLVSSPVEAIAPWEAVPVIDTSKSYEKIVSRNPRPCINIETRNRILQQLNELMEEEKEYFEAFLYEVDASIYPEYYCIIPVPMYLDLIERRLRNDYYRQIDSLEFDVDLMLKNCVSFNGEGTEIVDTATKLASRLHHIVRGEQYEPITSNSISTSSSSATTNMTIEGNNQDNLDENLTLRIPRRTRIKSYAEDEEEEMAFDEPEKKERKTRNNESNQFILRLSNRKAQVELQSNSTTRRSSRLASEHLDQLVSESMRPQSNTNRPANEEDNRRKTRLQSSMTGIQTHNDVSNGHVRSTRNRLNYFEGNSDESDDFIEKDRNDISKRKSIDHKNNSIEIIVDDDGGDIAQTRLSLRSSRRGANSVYDEVKNDPNQRPRRSRSTITKQSAYESDTSESPKEDDSDNDESVGKSYKEMSLKRSSRLSSRKRKSGEDDIDDDPMSNGIRRSKRARRSTYVFDQNNSSDDDEVNEEPIRRSRRLGSKDHHSFVFENGMDESNVHRKPTSSNDSFVHNEEDSLVRLTQKRLDPDFKRNALKLLNAISEADTNEYFAYPVTDEEVPGYSKVISLPMDLSTIRDNFMKRKYDTIQDLVNDLELMFDNCLEFNDPRAIVVKEAKRLRKLMLSVRENIDH